MAVPFNEKYAHLAQERPISKLYVTIGQKFIFSCICSRVRSFPLHFPIDIHSFQNIKHPLSIALGAGYKNLHGTKNFTRVKKIAPNPLQHAVNLAKSVPDRLAAITASGGFRFSFYKNSKRRKG
jgi:hypothetical protein